MNDAEALLQALGKLVRGAFQRRTVNAEANGGFRLPAIAGGVHIAHNLQGKGRGGRIGMGTSRHIPHALAQPGVTQGNGGIAVIQQLVDGLPFAQPGDGAVLPQDGSRIG